MHAAVLRLRLRGLRVSLLRAHERLQMVLLKAVLFFYLLIMRDNVLGVWRGHHIHALIE